jgi:hypothetical protein
MAKKRYLNTKFWNDNYVANLDPSEKLLFIYCLTNQYTDICGVYEVPLKNMALETGLDKEMVIKILDRFTKDEKIYYLDGWIYVRNWTKHQMFNDSVKLGMNRGFNLIPEEIRAKISEINTACIQPDNKVYTESTLLKPILKPKPIYSPNSATASSDQKNFDIFWQAYPKKIGRKKVMEVFLNIEDVPVDVMVKAIEIQKQSAQWQNPQYIPLPLTWLRQGRWEDEVTVINGADPIKNKILKLIDECDGNKEDAMHIFAKDNDMTVLKKYMKMFNTF